MRAPTPYPGRVTSAPRIFALTALAGLALVLAACTGTAAPETSTSTPAGTSPIVSDTPCASDEGVTIIVDSGDLAGEFDRTTCVRTDAAIGAADALALAAVHTEGTTEYPDEIVCRVDGVPAADTELVATDGTVVTESCESMPPAHAYWSLWVKPAGTEWGYAQEGLATLELEPGDSLELLFQLNGEPAAPTS